MASVTWDRNLLLELYRTMLTIRIAEESFVPLILDGTVRCPVHLYSGQEAIATGLCRVLGPQDYVFGSHRSHGHFLAKGGSIRKLVAEVYCREDGCSRGRGGSMHLIDPENGMLGSVPIVAGTIALAVGAALAARIRRDDRVVVTFFGDGATGEGVLYESMNFAVVKRLPIIFACENNLYSTHMPSAKSGGGSRLPTWRVRSGCRSTPSMATISWESTKRRWTLWRGVAMGAVPRSWSSSPIGCAATSVRTTTFKARRLTLGLPTKSNSGGGGIPLAALKPSRCREAE